MKKNSVTWNGHRMCFCCVRKSENNLQSVIANDDLYLVAMMLLFRRKCKNMNNHHHPQEKIKEKKKLDGKLKIFLYFHFIRITIKHIYKYIYNTVILRFISILDGLLFSLVWQGKNVLLSCLTYSIPHNRWRHIERRKN